FEVHEVLEAVWKTAAGATRQALQGVIQIAVAYHHLMHGNRRGARSLLVEGRSRLASVPATTLPALDVAALLAATAPWGEARASSAPTPAGSTMDAGVGSEDAGAAGCGPATTGRAARTAAAVTSSGGRSSRGATRSKGPSARSQKRSYSARRAGSRRISYACCAWRKRAPSPPTSG